MPTSDVTHSATSDRTRIAQLSLLLMCATILVNVAWPIFMIYGQRLALTIAGVLTFGVASLLNAVSTQGIRFTIIMVFVVGIGSLLIEITGVHTGIPFGQYFYTEALGFDIYGVPIIIACAWLMMLYPCFIVGRMLSRNIWMSSSCTAWLMATWDLYLDPQMVNEQYWRWGSPDSQGSTNIPWTNFLGWFLAAFLLTFTMHLLLRGANTTATATGTPSAVRYCTLALGWVWLGNFVANILWFAPYFNRPFVAVQGFVGMGVVLIPWLVRTDLRRT